MIAARFHPCAEETLRRGAEKWWVCTIDAGDAISYMKRAGLQAALNVVRVVCGPCPLPLGCMVKLHSVFIVASQTRTISSICEIVALSEVCSTNGISFYREALPPVICGVSHQEIAGELMPWPLHTWQSEPTEACPQMGTSTEV